MTSLEGKVALVTGAASGIGQAIAVLFANNGVNVALADIQEPADTLKLIKEKGHDAFSVKIDVTNIENINTCVNKVISEYGCLDILSNNAGIYNNGTSLEYTEQLWDNIMNINLKGAFFVAQACARHMAKHGGGKIINTSSQAGKFAEFSNVGYCITKTGVNMMTRVMAMELAEYGINVNAVCPGYTETPLLINSYRKKSEAYGKSIEDVKKEMFESVPLKRAAKPSEVAKLVLFLASSSADYITGESIIINGGQLTE